MKKTTNTISLPLRAFTPSLLLLLRVSLFLCVIATFIGCYKPSPPVTELTEAHKKLEALLPEDYNINAVIQHFPNTLYIYVPVDFNILKTKAATPNPFSRPQTGPKRQINFVETSFTSSQFTIQYDISTVNVYPKDLGYTSVYTDQFSRINQNILGALTRSYGDLDEDQHPMDFVVVMIIDVRNGIGLKSIFHYKDLEMAMIQALPQDEYAKRYMTEMLGSDDLVGNWKGRGLGLHDIAWPEFIAKQITYRINFKYSRSSFPPMETNVKEILAVVNDTMTAYDFEDFETVRLENLADETTESFGKEELITDH